jgi:hypothetical protein
MEVYLLMAIDTSKPYTDPGLTTGAPFNDGAEIPTPLPEPKDITSLGRDETYDIEGTNFDPGDQGAEVPPHAPLPWAPGRDLYANGGGVGQDFLDNQG